MHMFACDFAHLQVCLWAALGQARMNVIALFLI